jgi:hypothetical protein
LGLAQFYSTGKNPPGQPVHRTFSPTRVRQGVVLTAPLSVPTVPAATAPRATSPHVLHAQAMPLLHVRRFSPSLSPALSSVRSKDCSNRQHHRHLARSCSAADVVPLLPTTGHRRREMPRCASSRKSSWLSVCLHEPSRGAPPSERSDERPPSSSVVGHSTTGGPLWSSSGLVSASTSITPARSTSTSTQTPASTTPTAPHRRAPSADRAAMGSATPVSPSPPPTLKSDPHSAMVIPDRFSRLRVPPTTGIDRSRRLPAPWQRLPCSGSGLPAHGDRRPTRMG